MDSVALVKKIELDMDNALGEVRKSVTSEVKHVLEKNADFNTLYRISCFKHV